MRIRWSEAITATYDAALSRITQPEARTPPPIAAMSRPATAGPTRRAALKEAELSPTALERSSGPTISETNDCRAGASKAVPTPKTRAATRTCQVCTTPVTASRPSTSELSAMPAWVTCSRRRLGKRSATNPAYGLSRSMGRNCRPVVTPSRVPDPVSTSTSQSWAIRIIQVPVLDTSEPVAYSR